MNDIDLELIRIGNELRNAAQRDLAQPRVPRRRLVTLLVAALVVLGAGAGIAATVLNKTAQQEERGLVDGSATFAGTHPTCTQVSLTQFHCVLASVPTELTFPNGGTFVGVKMSSVDSTKHVDGGCVGRSRDGLVWDCYLGQEAVRRGIVDSGYLGQFVPDPPHA